MLKAFLDGFETGKYVQEPMVEYYKATAFKLEPLSESILTVDGEVTNPKLPIFVQVYHNAMNFFWEPPNSS